MSTPVAPPSPSVDFAAVLGQCRQFLLAIANADLPPALRAKCGASDLVQQTLTAAVAHRHQFRGTTLADLRAWLRVILRNELADSYRLYLGTAARDVRREVPLGSAAGLPAPAGEPAAALTVSERERQIAAGLAELDDDSRRAVQWRLEDGVGFAEIGARLGRTEEAARKLYTRGLDRLRGLVPAG